MKLKYKEILGDCIEEMQKLIDDGVQIDSIVTDPPYHLISIVKRFGSKNATPAKDKDGAFQRQSVGFMGKEWDGGDVAFRSDTWKLAYNLLKPGGHLLAFSASRNYHRMAVAIEDAGFEIRDQIMWIYGSGFPKSLNIGKAIDKRLGNERESLGMYDPRSLQDGANRTERPIGNQQVANYESSMVERTKGNSEWEGWGTALKPAHEPIVMARKPLEGTNIDNVFKYGTGGINIDGCRVGNEERTHKGKSSLGVMHDDNWKPTDIEVTSQGRYPANVMHDGLQEEWARYFYCPKVSKSERNNSTIKNTHPTVKPIKLMRYLCRLVTPKGGIVLDPFMGSGSTGIATKQENFQFIGIEKEKEYYDIACKRIEATIEQNDLFNL